jgi:Glycosyl transferase family 90
MAIYRGGLTGMNRKRTTSSNHRENEMEELIWCQQIPRCNLVLQHGNSNYVDAKLVQYRSEAEYRVQPVLQNTSMFGNSMKFQEMLQYKAIIMLEGNDVSTGLKWSLYSNSVVLTPKPTCTSWAMEELLQPFVHYIPLYDNLTNVEEQVQWIRDHDDEAQQIAHNGKLWMLDLAYHPQVAKDTEDILDETFERYMKHFIYNPNLQI